MELWHFRLCPLSRSIRLALAEANIAFAMVEERAWEWPAALVARNPAGELPVMETAEGVVVCGAGPIAEYLAEAEPDQPGGSPASLTLFPGDREQRAEVRRLVSWFQHKFHREVTSALLAEKVYPLLTLAASRAATAAAATPSPAAIRAIRANLRHHLSYIGHLAEQRPRLAGEQPSFADLAAAAQISVVDYLDEISWDHHASAKAWYQRIKSRPSFRALLADRLPGFPPPPHYADLDF